MKARTFAADAALKVGVLVAMFVVWLLWTRSKDSIFFPSPTEVLPAVWNDWFLDGATWTDNIFPSLQRLLFGFFLAAILSIALGLVLGRSRALSEYVEPTIHFLRAIPPPALLFIFLILFGINDLQKIALIAFGVAPPILLNSIEGARAVEALHLETAKAYQIGARDKLTHVILPAAAPKIFAGLRVSMSLAVILMVISEFVFASDGIGFRVFQASRNFAYVDLWAGIVVLGILGVVLNVLLGVVEHRTLRWGNS